jgi:flagellar biosynthetic protein FliP
MKRILAILLISLPVLAQDPAFSINIGGSGFGDQQATISSAMKLLLFITALSFGPAMMMTMTSFTKIAIVLGMVRTTLGVQSAPPNMVITGLALFLTVNIMAPVFKECYEAGFQQYMEGTMSEKEALEKGLLPLKKFLIKHSREKDLALFIQVTKSELPDTPEEVPFFVAVPAFVLSELNMAFQIGFLIAMPFLILDMVVSSVLTSMSMITLPPVVISLPLKLMLFVLVDGWYLIIQSLIKGYGG